MVGPRCLGGRGIDAARDRRRRSGRLCRRARGSSGRRRWRRRVADAGARPPPPAAARGYRAAGGDGAVELLTRELVLPSGRPPLSKEFLREEIGDEDLPLERDAWYENHGVTVRRGVEAERLVPQAKTILLGNGAT